MPYKYVMILIIICTLILLYIVYIYILFLVLKGIMSKDNKELELVIGDQHQIKHSQSLKFTLYFIQEGTNRTVYCIQFSPT